MSGRSEIWRKYPNLPVMLSVLGSSTGGVRRHRIFA